MQVQDKNIPKQKPIFTKEMKKTHTILVPTMLPIHFKLLGDVLKMYGYNVKILDNSGHQVINEGLKNVHNDICYPAQLVIGQLIDAVNNTDLDLDKIALLITQTGGGCRASNYLYLLRKALDKCGYTQIPVVSATFLKSEDNPGFSLPLGMVLQLVYGCLCGDLIMSLNNQCCNYLGKRCGSSYFISIFTVNNSIGICIDKKSDTCFIFRGFDIIISALCYNFIFCFCCKCRSTERKH